MIQKTPNQSDAKDWKRHVADKFQLFSTKKTWFPQKASKALPLRALIGCERVQQCSGLKGGELSLSSACKGCHLIGCQGLAFEGGAAELEEEDVLELGLGARRTTAPQSEETSPPGRIPRLMHGRLKSKGTLRS